MTQLRNMTTLSLIQKNSADGQNEKNDHNFSGENALGQYTDGIYLNNVANTVEPISQDEIKPAKEFLYSENQIADNIDYLLKGYENIFNNNTSKVRNHRSKHKNKTPAKIHINNVDILLKGYKDIFGNKSSKSGDHEYEGSNKTPAKIHSIIEDIASVGKNVDQKNIQSHLSNLGESSIEEYQPPLKVHIIDDKLNTMARHDDDCGKKSVLETKSKGIICNVTSDRTNYESSSPLAEQIPQPAREPQQHVNNINIDHDHSIPNMDNGKDRVNYDASIQYVGGNNNQLVSANNLDINNDHKTHNMNDGDNRMNNVNIHTSGEGSYKDYAAASSAIPYSENTPQVQFNDFNGHNDHNTNTMASGYNNKINDATIHDSGAAAFPNLMSHSETPVHVNNTIVDNMHSMEGGGDSRSNDFGERTRSSSNGGASPSVMPNTERMPQVQFNNLNNGNSNDHNTNTMASGYNNKINDATIHDSGAAAFPNLMSHSETPVHVNNTIVDNMHNMEGGGDSRSNDFGERTRSSNNGGASPSVMPNTERMPQVQFNNLNNGNSNDHNTNTMASGYNNKINDATIHDSGAAAFPNLMSHSETPVHVNNTIVDNMHNMEGGGDSRSNDFGERSRSSNTGGASPSVMPNTERMPQVQFSNFSNSNSNDHNTHTMDDANNKNDVSFHHSNEELSRGSKNYAGLPTTITSPSMLSNHANNINDNINNAKNMNNYITKDNNNINNKNNNNNNNNNNNQNNNNVQNVTFNGMNYHATNQLAENHQMHNTGNGNDKITSAFNNQDSTKVSNGSKDYTHLPNNSNDNITSPNPSHHTETEQHVPTNYVTGTGDRTGRYANGPKRNDYSEPNNNNYGIPLTLNNNRGDRLSGGNNPAVISSQFSNHKNAIMQRVRKPCCANNMPSSVSINAGNGLRGSNNPTEISGEFSMNNNPVMQAVRRPNHMPSSLRNNAGDDLSGSYNPSIINNLLRKNHRTQPHKDRILDPSAHALDYSSNQFIKPDQGMFNYSDDASDTGTYGFGVNNNFQYATSSNKINRHSAFGGNMQHLDEQSNRRKNTRYTPYPIQHNFDQLSSISDMVAPQIAEMDGRQTLSDQGGVGGNDGSLLSDGFETQRMSYLQDSSNSFSENSLDEGPINYATGFRYGQQVPQSSKQR